MGYIGIFIAIGQGLGPFIGGELAERLTWRVCIPFHLYGSYLLNRGPGVVVVFLDHSTNRRCWNWNCFISPPAKECRG